MMEVGRLSNTTQPSYRVSALKVPKLRRKTIVIFYN